MLEVDRGREGTGRDTKLANEHSDKGARLARNHRRHSPGPAGQAQELQRDQCLLAACYLRAVRATNGRKRDHIALSAGHGVRRGQLEDRLQCQTTGEDHLRNGSADEGARVQGSGATGTEGAAHVPGAGRVRVVCGQAAAAARPEPGVDYSELSEGDSAGC